MGAFGVVLAVVCVALASTALGLVAAAWSTPARWGLRFARGVVVTIGAATVLLAALHPIAQATR